MIAKIAKIGVLGLVFLVAAGISAYVTLTIIIKSEDTVIVPDLVGKDVVSALEMLTDLQLNTKVYGSEYNQQFPKNHVTFQEPEAGAEIKKDRDVRIIISKGAKSILMPNIVSLSEQQARMIIEENGLTRGRMSRAFDSRVEKNHVIVQVPRAGRMITRGDRVDVLISMGPAPVKYLMPDLIGHHLDRAVLMIENANLTVGNLRSRFDRQKSHNSVISQEPPAGFGVNSQDPVDLVINRPPGQASANRQRRPLLGSLLQYRVKSGFLKKRVRVEMENTQLTTELFDDFIKPGQEIWVLIPVEHDAAVFIYEDDELVKTQIYEAW
jgi:serine/threonine-protein kinase